MTSVLSSRRNLIIASSVVVFHAAALWALQSGLVRRTIEIIVPAVLLSEIVTPPAPKAAPVPPAPPKPVVEKKKRIEPAPAPMPVARPDPVPVPTAPTGVAQPQPAPPPVAAPVSVSTPPAPAPAPPAPAKVELPSSSADYLQNPAPHYPPLSKRMGEQGKVVVRVLIGTDGLPQKSELKKSSGYDRLDRAALDYVMRCRYVPGKVGGVPQAMWYEAPVNFVLE